MMSMKRQPLLWLLLLLLLPHCLFAMRVLPSGAKRQRVGFWIAGLLYFLTTSDYTSSGNGVSNDSGVVATIPTALCSCAQVL
jgi:hypothetical protein